MVLNAHAGGEENGFQNTKPKKQHPAYLDGTMNMTETLIHYSNQIDAMEKTSTT